jgi:hypothetical protein
MSGYKNSMRKLIVTQIVVPLRPGQSPVPVGLVVVQQRNRTRRRVHVRQSFYGKCDCDSNAQRHRETCRTTTTASFSLESLRDAAHDPPPGSVQQTSIIPSIHPHRKHQRRTNTKPILKTSPGHTTFALHDPSSFRTLSPFPFPSPSSP